MHKFLVKCVKPIQETLGESKNIAESKNLIIEHYENATGSKMDGVDRIVCTASLMVSHAVELEKYHYILEKQ